MKKSFKSFSRALILCSALLLSLHLSPGLSYAQASPIDKVLVAQALGNQSNKYVAGKDAAILVYLTQATPVDATQQSLVVKLGGATVTTIQPTPSNDPVTVLSFVCPSRAACGDWKAGDYTFVATVSGSTSQATATFTERKKLTVLAVPVKANYGPGDVRSTTGAWRAMGDFTRAVYPVAADGIIWTTGDEVDASGDDFNLKTDAGQEKMFREVVKVQPKECLQDPRPAGVQCPDKVVAFVKDRMGAGGDLQGFTMGFNTNIVVEGDQDAPATVAHEVGHNYNLGDEYRQGKYNCGVNPPPPDFVGEDIISGQTPYSCGQSQNQPYPDAQADVIKATTDAPFEVGGRSLLPDMASFMGSGAPQNRNWISAPSWARIFDGLAPGQGGYRFDIMSASTQAQAETRWIYAQGFIGRDDSVELAPWYDYDEVGTQKNSAGLYTLQAVDASGKVLASTSLTVSFDVIDSPRVQNRALFEADMPFPDGTSRFQIVKGGGSNPAGPSSKLLKEAPVSANAPDVRLLTPKAGEVVNSKAYTVQWQGSDKDGDTLHYDLEYSIDGQNWDLLESNLQTTQAVIDFSDLPGNNGATARIRVTATDA